jgi:hypothetical protein
VKGTPLRFDFGRGVFWPEIWRFAKTLQVMTRKYPGVKPYAGRKTGTPQYSE